MTARILSGKEIAEAIKREVAEEVKAIAEQHGFRPCLAVVRVGEDAASAVYVGSKVKTSEELGMISEHHHLSAEVSHEELLNLVKDLNSRTEVDGILVLPVAQAAVGLILLGRMRAPPLGSAGTPATRR